MNPKVAAEIARLNDLTVSQLAQRFEELFGEPCLSRHRKYLIRRISWRLQANAEGGLSERARKRAEELAEDAEVRVTAPREKRTDNEPTPAMIKMMPGRDSRLPPPGNWIERPYKGRTVRVLVVADGFEYEGQRYKSLSAVAKAVTGSHTNGFLFFRLGRDA